jgi:predicted permease
MLFYNIFAEENIIKAINLKLVLFVIGGAIFLFLVLLFFMNKYIKNHQRTGVMIQGSFRSNYLLFGIPLTPIEGRLTTSIVAGFYVPILNILATLALYIYSDDENKNLRKAFISSITNPLVLSGVLGIVLGITRNFLNISIPNVIDNPIRQIVNLATPFTFILLGGDLHFKNLYKNIKYSFTASFIKTIVFPSFLIPLAVLFGFSGYNISSIIAASSTPNAVSSYTMARIYKADYQLAGEIVVLSTVMSMLTLFITITICAYLGLINRPI